MGIVNIKSSARRDNFCRSFLNVIVSSFRSQLQSMMNDSGMLALLPTPQTVVGFGDEWPPRQFRRPSALSHAACCCCGFSRMLSRFGLHWRDFANRRRPSTMVERIDTACARRATLRLTIVRSRLSLPSHPPALRHQSATSAWRGEWPMGHDDSDAIDFQAVIIVKRRDARLFERFKYGRRLFAPMR